MGKTDTLFQDLGKAIRKQRETLGLSQQQVADLASVSVNLVRQVESGKSSAYLSKVLDIMTAVGLQFDLVPGNSRLSIKVG